MAEKCELCGEAVEIAILDKPIGTIVKIKEGEKNVKKFVCSACQKKFGNKLKEELLKQG